MLQGLAVAAGGIGAYPALVIRLLPEQRNS
jgi:hypothetical protein